MNIFFLDYDPQKAAIYHCDKHVVKMITETSQLLSTAHHVLDRTDNKIFMLPCYVNHPCNLWVRKSLQNYLWARNLLHHLIEEYDFRYEKYDNFRRARLIAEHDPPKNFPSLKWTKPYLAVPDDCKISEDPVECYREYYRKHKSKFATWKKRGAPAWF